MKELTFFFRRFSKTSLNVTKFFFVKNEKKKKSVYFDEFIIDIWLNHCIFWVDISTINIVKIFLDREDHFPIFGRSITPTYAAINILLLFLLHINILNFKIIDNSY